MKILTTSRRRFLRSTTRLKFTTSTPSCPRKRLKKSKRDSSTRRSITPRNRPKKHPKRPKKSLNRPKRPVNHNRLPKRRLRTSKSSTNSSRAWLRLPRSSFSVMPD